MPAEVPPPESPTEDLTIDELGRLTGTTVRNIRAYQSRGLLPPPSIRARTGYYGPEHVRRLGVIQAMQAEGFRLDAIQRGLDRPGLAAERMFKFGRELLSAFAEEPEYATTAELEQRLGGALDPRLVRKAQKLGLIRPLGQDRWEILNPTLVSAGEQLADMGVPLSHALAVAETIDRHTRDIAKAYMRLFRTDVLGEQALSQRTSEDWDRLDEMLERLRPLATEAIRASFEHAMGEVVEQEMKKLMDRG
jgi:DNA-binding transcriptional MerR regulator